MSTTESLKVNLSGRVAVVTGATRGIGFTIAETFAKSGAKVACIGTNADKLNTSVASIRAAALENGGDAEAFVCNVADANAIEETTKVILAKYEKIDILVNNAGIVRDKLLRQMTNDDWDDVLAINLRGTFLMTRAFIEIMRRKKYGRIINITSVSGIKGNRGQANYSASKAGMIGFTKTVALELANRNITVNAIAPGFIATDMTSGLSETVIAVAKGIIPMGEMGQSQHIADAALFFASEAASYITGQVLAVDGGMTV